MGDRDNTRQVRLPPDRESSRSSILLFTLLYVIAFGVVLLLVMLATAFGPSASAFGIIICVIAVAFIVRRYRFSLRTFLLAVTVLSLWLGFKLNRDVSTNRGLSGIVSSGGRLEVHDRRPDFPWGLWKHRYRLDYYGLKQPLSEKDFSNLEGRCFSIQGWLTQPELSEVIEDFAAKTSLGTLVW